MAGTRRPFLGVGLGSPYGQFPLAASYFPIPERLVAYLPFDGVNGATTAADLAGGQTASRVAGTGTISTTDPRIGTGCWQNENTGSSRLNLPTISPHLPADNWTVGGWVKRTGACTHFGLGSVGTVRFLVLKTPVAHSGSYELAYAETGGVIAASSSGVGSTWAHFEFCRRLNGATPELYIFFNGELESFTSGASGGSNWPSGSVDIGFTNTSSDSGLYGAIDDWYLYAECLHTASFTPPAGPVFVP